MATKELLDYIDQRRKAGVVDNMIRIELIGKGWISADIDTAMGGKAVLEPLHSKLSTEATSSVTPPQDVGLTKQATMTPRANFSTQRNAEEYIRKLKMDLGPLVPEKEGHSHGIIITALSFLIVGAMYIGLSFATQTNFSLDMFLNTGDLWSTSSIMYMVSMTILTLIFVVIGTLWGRDIYRKNHAPYTGFLFGTAVYLFFCFIIFGISNGASVIFENATTTDPTSYTSFEIVLAFLFSVGVAIFFLGLILCELFLVLFITFGTPLEQVRSSRFARFCQTVSIFLVLLISFYGFGAIRPIAEALHGTTLCNFIYDTGAKKDCAYIATGQVDTVHYPKPLPHGDSI